VLWPQSDQPEKAFGAARLMGTRHLLWFLEHQFGHRGCGMGPHCSSCGTFTGPFSEVEGLFTVLICIPCLEVRLAQPDTLLGLHDPGQPWNKWGCPIEGCGRWVPRPLGTWRGTPQPSIPAGRRPMSCCGPIRTSAGGSCTAAARRRRADLPIRRWGQLAVLDRLVTLVLTVVVDDPQDLDEAEGGPQPAQGRLLVGVDLGHGTAGYRRRGSSRRAPRCR
jgi:hypothetical protein